MGLVVCSVPLTRAAIGSFNHLDGPQQFGVSIMSYATGFMAALVYLVIATAAHFMVWKKSIRTKCWVEGLLLFVFICVLVFENL